MQRRVKSLRRTLTLVVISGAALAMCLVIALLVMSALMQRATGVTRDAMEGVLIAEEAEIALFLHAGTTDPIVRNHLEQELRRRVRSARGDLTTPGEAELHADVTRTVEAYLAVTQRGEATTAALPAAHRSLEALVENNLDRAEIARKRVARWNWISDAIAASVAVLIAVSSVVLILWVRRRAFQPVFALAAVMQRFGRGERTARATPGGPEELELMSERFNEMAEAIAARRQAQSAFLGGVAHDLRGPVGAIKLALSMIEVDEEDEARRPIEIANRQITRLERMINDFLDSARIEAGELELRWQVIDARSLVGDAVELVRDASPNQELEIVLPDQRVPVRCDPLRLEQVVVNLLSNAIKYSPEGGTIRLAIERTADRAILSVTDPGIGISIADQQRLFEPFRRVGFSKGTIPGVGLGLFVVRRIVESHGGKIEVRSAPGVGSTFIVSLPLVSAGAVAETADVRLGTTLPSPP